MYSIQHCVIKFISDLWLLDCFLHLFLCWTQRLLLNYVFEIGGMQIWKGISFKILKYNFLLRIFDSIRWFKLYIKLNYCGHDNGSRLQTPLRSLLEKIGSGFQTMNILPKYLHMEYIYIYIYISWSYFSELVVSVMIFF